MEHGELDDDDKYVVSSLHPRQLLVVNAWAHVTDNLARGFGYP